MKFVWVITAVVVILSVFAFTKATPRHVWMIGDSTMANKKAEAAPETGWGMVLHEFVKSNVVVHNHALNGRSSKSFRDEGRWKALYDSIQPGDFVIIQFGHNDAKTDSARHTIPSTTYKQQLKRYIEESRAKGANPIICSSIVRRHFDPKGNLLDTHGAYISAAKEVAIETRTPYVDMEAKTRKVVADLGPEKSKSLYLFTASGEYPNRPKGVQDSTHLKRAGAIVVAKLFIEEVKNQQLPIAQLFK